MYRLGFDIDGVLGNITQLVIDLAREEYGVEFKQSDAKCWWIPLWKNESGETLFDVPNYLSEKERIQQLRLYEKEFWILAERKGMFKKMLVLPQAYELCKRLKTQGHYLIINSSRGSQGIPGSTIIPETIVWLEQNFKSIFDEIRLSANGETKVEKSEGCDLHIDDCYDDCIKLNMTGILTVMSKTRYNSGRLDNVWDFDDKNGLIRIARCCKKRGVGTPIIRINQIIQLEEIVEAMDKLKD